MTLLESLLVGAGLAISLAAPPGPVMAKMAFEVARRRTWTGILVGLGASSADMTYFALVHFGILGANPDPRLLGALALCGVALMDYFAYQAWRAARSPLPIATKGASGFAGGYLIALTSPFNLLWWVSAGAPFIAVYGPQLIIGFAVALVSWVILTAAVFHYAARRVPRFEMYVSYASAGLLVLFGALLAFRGLLLLA